MISVFERPGPWVRAAYALSVLATIGGAAAFSIPLIAMAIRGKLQMALANPGTAAYLLAMTLMFARSAIWLDRQQWQGAALAAGLFAIGGSVAVFHRETPLHASDIVWLIGLLTSVRAALLLRAPTSTNR